MRDNYLIFLIAAHVITELLVNNIFPALEIRMWWNIKYILLVRIILVLITTIMYLNDFSYRFELASTILLLLHIKLLTKSDRYTRATKICFPRLRQIWIIWILYTSGISNKLFFPLAIHNFSNRWNSIQ